MSVLTSDVIQNEQFCCNELVLDFAREGVVQGLL